MGSRDPQVQLTQMTLREALALVLGEAAAAAAGRAVREGGYRPLPEQLKEISRRLMQEALSAGLVLPGARMEGLTGEVLAEAAELSALQVVLEVLGPPPVAH